MKKPPLNTHWQLFSLETSLVFHGQWTLKVAAQRNLGKKQLTTHDLIPWAGWRKVGGNRTHSLAGFTTKPARPNWLTSLEASLPS